MKEMVDVEGKPVGIGDRVVFNCGKRDSGVNLGTVVGIKRGKLEVNADVWNTYTMLKESTNVYKL